MNLLTEIDRNRLFNAVSQSYRGMEWARNLNRGLVEEYAGSGYGKLQGEKRTIYLNLMNQAVDAYQMTLVANRPRVMISTHHLELTDFAKQYQLAVNNLIAEIELEVTLRQWVLDAFFCLGVVKVHMADAGVMKLEENRLIDPGTPWASNISIDNYVYDLPAVRRHETRYEGDMYRISMESLQRGDIFDPKAASDIKPTTKYGGDDDRLRRISHGEMVDADELEPMTDVIDLWIPSEGRIFTFAVEDTINMKLNGKPLADMPWDGPELGPYHLLGFNDVPENIMPCSPASHLAPLNRDINSAIRKQWRRARNGKNVHTYTSGAADDAKKIRDASDDQWLQVNDPTQIGMIPTGGADPNLQSFLLGNITLFDRLAGNLTAMLGLGAQADTKGQEELIHGAVSKKAASMMYRVVDGSIKIVRDLGHLLWHDQFKTMRGQLPIEGAGPGYFVDATWTPEDREGNFFDYNFNIDMYSMPYQSPREKTENLTNFLTGVLAPLFPLIQAGALDGDAMTDIYADLYNEPRLRQIYKFAAPPPMAPPTDSLTPQIQSSQPKEYLHRRVSTGGSPEGARMTEQQMWAGMSQNGQVNNTPMPTG